MVHARLNAAIDAEAGDVHYHTSCYTCLKNDAHAAISKSSNSNKRSSSLHYDPLVITQLVAFVQLEEAFGLGCLHAPEKVPRMPSSEAKD